MLLLMQSKLVYQFKHIYIFLNRTTRSTLIHSLQVVETGNVIRMDSIFNVSEKLLGGCSNIFEIEKILAMLI